MTDVWVVRSGRVPYASARQAQRALEAARYDDRVPDLLLLLEHPPVYTRGRRSTPEELPMGEHWYRMQGIEVAETNRGGRVTYHGPGQLVGYPIVSLAAYRDDVHEYVRGLERAMVAALGDWGVEAGTLDGLTGVWTAGARPDAAPQVSPHATEPVARKIGSIGVHVNRGVTTHGFAVNVNNDLQPFEWIVPCGIEACRVTSVSRERGERIDLEAFASTIRDRFSETFGRRAVETNAIRLTELVEGAEGLADAAVSPVA